MNFKLFFKYIIKISNNLNVFIQFYTKANQYKIYVIYNTVSFFFDFNTSLGKWITIQIL